MVSQSALRVWNEGREIQEQAAVFKDDWMNFQLLFLKMLRLNSGKRLELYAAWKPSRNGEIPQGEICRLRLFQSPHPSRLPPGHCQSPSVALKVRKFSLAGPGWPWKVLAKCLEALLYVAAYLRGHIAAYPLGDASGGSPKHCCVQSQSACLQGHLLSPTTTLCTCSIAAQTGKPLVQRGLCA